MSLNKQQDRDTPRERRQEPSSSRDTDGRLAHLERLIAEYHSVAVAFSGGADSTLLLAVSLRALGRDKVLAITADSPSLPRRELMEARALASELGAEHIVIETDELDDERFVHNAPDRCFYCKQELFDRIRSLATERGYAQMLYGATAADLRDHRPGMAAAKGAGALAPLLQAGFSKDDVREVSRRLGLRTWDKPAMACLASRIPYGQRITPSALSRVEQAEDLLRRDLGFTQVRVRDHDTIARIEIDPQDLARAIEGVTRDRIVSALVGLGYTYVTLDLRGFRSGSMNETWQSVSGGAGEGATALVGVAASPVGQEDR